MLTPEEITNASKTIGLDYATVAAVTEIESGGSGFDLKTKFPKILFEGHIFSRLTGGKYDTSNPTISYPKWTKQFYGKTQDVEQARLHQAIQLDRVAALKSASYGLFQIMGMNFGACGCKDIQEFVNLMCQSEQKQLELFLKFIKSQNLLKFLQIKDWASFAKGYNGPAYKQNNYDIKLANAYLKYTKQ